jgi:hypothetical protein
MADVCLKLAAVEAIRDVYNAKYTECNAFEHPVDAINLFNQNVFILSPQRPNHMFVYKQAKNRIMLMIVMIIMC